MEETPNYWLDLYKIYYRVPKDKKQKQKAGMSYNAIRLMYLKQIEIDADEPAIPDEEYQKELEMVKAYETENAKLEETSNELTLEEIEEFKKLNGINDEQPTETKVKSVKVSKPKEKKVVEKEKPVKNVKQKEAKPKAPRKPKK